ncbi:DUF1501 domain-containing protein [Psychromonas ossibalaenae]|uniref:DUF1501 domain-containing protein n=1 Tax=Psychromonas ossibalaenae TaxID=444922 RepID=UPI00036C4371|nr:DUF1501 domain-containing protein [Psychromonas ossibalaenae]
MKLSRRNFLKMGATVASSTALTTIPGIASADSSESTHKAIVCILLNGGNDAYNMLIPLSESAYSDYALARPALAIKEEDVLPLGLNTDNAVELGIHPAMSAMLPLFKSGQATAVINSGPLVEPLTRSTIEQGLGVLPDFLMAHNLQQEMVQSGTVSMSNRYAWAGRMMDIIGVNSSVSPLIAIGNDCKLLRSAKYKQTVVNSDGVGSYTGWNSSHRVSGYFSHFVNRDYENLYSHNFSKRMSSSVLENEELNEVLQAYPATGSYPDTHLADQLKMVSRLIQANKTMGQKRQVFFVELGGFDTHNDQDTTHRELLTQVSDALAAFNQDIAAHKLEEQVTSVTMSDFGRRVRANSTGTDHGWGGHQIITGGAVKGGKAYGNWPQLTSKSEDDYSNGRVIPSISTDQVNASLCEWFGLNTGQIHSLFPNLINFQSPTLDFMTTQKV